MKTKIIKTNIDWKDVKNISRTTVNKEHSDNEATSVFKKKILISEHSPIRELNIRWMWNGIKSWIATHFSRHKWECYISTRRTDRTGVDRDFLHQGELLNMEGSANAQHLIDMARKRLCYQSSKETREYMEDLKISLYETEPEISNALVPNCVYRFGCPEFKECGYWTSIISKIDIKNDDIQSRYDKYNEIFYNSKVTEV